MDTELKTLIREHFIRSRTASTLTFYRSPERTAREIAKFSEKDSRTYLKFHEMAKQFSEAVAPLMLAPPPALTDIVGVISGKEFEEIVRYFLLMGASRMVNEPLRVRGAEGGSLPA